MLESGARIRASREMREVHERITGREQWLLGHEPAGSASAAAQQRVRYSVQPRSNGGGASASQSRQACFELCQSASIRCIASR